MAFSFHSSCKQICHYFLSSEGLVSLELGAEVASGGSTLVGSKEEALLDNFHACISLATCVRSLGRMGLVDTYPTF